MPNVRRRTFKKNVHNIGRKLTILKHESAPMDDKEFEISVLVEVFEWFSILLSSSISKTKCIHSVISRNAESVRVVRLKIQERLVLSLL